MAARISSSQVESALDRVPAAELSLLLAELATLAADRPPGAAGVDAYLDLLRRDDVSGALKVAVGMARTRVLDAGDGDGNDARRAERELRSWRDRVQQRLTAAASTRSAGASSDPGPPLLPDLDDGRFIQVAHEAIARRGCHAHELVHWMARLARGEASRAQLLDALLQEAHRIAEADVARRADRELAFHVMGTGERVTQADWQRRAREAVVATAPDARATQPTAPPAQVPSVPAGSPLVSVLTSLYAGGEHIERFLANMTGQQGFRDHIELIVVDAASPDGERAAIERVQRDWPNIRYLRTPERIGIYEAWNLAVGLARGRYLTSANVDDLRRSDSLAQQAALLERLPFVDVVYQDFFYTLDPNLAFEQVAAVGIRSDLPLVTPHGLMRSNPPHNAPMWRRALHDELGLFDEGLQSAGDYDFWMRCVLAGKVFYKLDDPHVAYFHNPRGISTRPDTRGHAETREVHRRYGRRLVSEALAEPLPDFLARCAAAGRAPAAGPAAGDRAAIVHAALLDWARVCADTEAAASDRPESAARAEVA